LSSRTSIVSEVVFGVEFRFKGLLHFFFINVDVKDLTRGILNLNPEVVVHGGGLRNKDNVAGLRGARRPVVPVQKVSHIIEFVAINLLTIEFAIALHEFSIFFRET